MPIKGLKKGDRIKSEKRSIQSINPQEFIEGANKRTKPVNKRQRIYKSATFSLNQDCIDKIEELTYIPRDFKVSRSGVIKAAIDLLTNQEQEVKLNFLNKYKD